MLLLHFICCLELPRGHLGAVRCPTSRAVTIANLVLVLTKEPQSNPALGLHNEITGKESLNGASLAVCKQGSLLLVREWLELESLVLTPTQDHV